MVLSFDQRSFDQLNMLNHSLPARATDPRFSLESAVAITHEQNIICSKALVCWQLFAGHVVSSRSMKTKEKIHRMIVGFGSSYPLDSHCLLDKTNLPLNNWGQVYIFCLIVCLSFLPDAAFPIPFCELLYTFKLDSFDNSVFVALASYCLVAD